MIIGYLRRRAREKRELDDLRAFAGEMEQYLDNVDLLMQMAEDEDEIPITTEGMWKPEYIAGAFRNHGRNVRIPVLCGQPMPISFPEPECRHSQARDHLHRGVRLRSEWMISDQEIMLRRTASEMAELIARVNEQMRHQIDAYLQRLAAMPIKEARREIFGGR